MRRLLRVSLQTKILVLVISIILSVIVLMTSVFAYMESKQIDEQKQQVALQTAKMVSFMPAIRDAMKSFSPTSVIQPIAEQVRDQTQADYVIVSNRDGVRYSYPDAKGIGRKMVGGDNYMAVVFGGYYTTKATGALGPAVRGKAPIFGDHGRIIGVVTVGFMIKDIKAAIKDKLIKISMFALIALAVGVIGGIILAKNIRRETLGLEPHQIAALFRERNAILLAIKEGIVAIDQYGKITMINRSAEEMLGVHDNVVGKPMIEVFPNTRMLEVLATGNMELNQETILNNKIVIANRTPIIEHNQVVGVVASFRDRTEIIQMVNTLSEVRKYSEDLRAQTHDYTNKLYVLSGLLQLNRHQEAIDMIQKEVIANQNQHSILFHQIKDHKLQAILLGKISKSAEQKVSFQIDPNSYIEALPNHIEISDLVTIVGNIIDNAFDAVSHKGNGHVSFFTTDIGKDVVFEIEDNGDGIEHPEVSKIFEKGYSTKNSSDRGFGLANVKEAIEKLHGVIEVQHSKQGGTIFSVYIPKSKKGD